MNKTIRVIEIFLILVLLSTGFVIVNKSLTEEDPAAVKHKVTYEMEVLLRGIKKSYMDEIQLESNLYDVSTGSLMGTVNNIEIKAYSKETTSSWGEILSESVDDHFDVFLTVEGEGSFDEELGLNAYGRLSYTGLYSKIRINQLSVYGTIIDIRHENID